MQILLFFALLCKFALFSKKKSKFFLTMFLFYLILCTIIISIIILFLKYKNYAKIMQRGAHFEKRANLHNFGF